MTNRKKLIKEIKKLSDCLGLYTPHTIAKFILEDRKRIVEEIMNLYSSEQWEGLKTLRELAGEQ